MKSISIFPIVVTLIFLSTNAASLDQPARPIERTAPEFPEECAQDSSEATQQFVDVIYDITREGTTENVRIELSTDSCFDGAAIEAVKQWRFDPQIVDGQPKPQLDTRTRLAFDMPTLQTAPPVVAASYPAKCAKDAKEVEYVTLRYDITAEGTTKNIEVVDSSSFCFEAHAKGSLASWQYEPRIIDGQAVQRTGIEVTLTYRLEN